MSDSKFINTYIDVIIGTLHEYLNSNLQLKTQVKVANDLILEKDGVISSLSQQIEEIKNSTSNAENATAALQAEMNKLSADAKLWQDSYHASQNKLSHMDTLTKQVSEMKNEIITRDNNIQNLNNEIQELKNQIEELKNPKPKVEEPPKVEESSVKTNLNSKVKPVSKANTEMKQTKVLPTDDF